MPVPTRRLVVILVRTSRYDDEGYVVRHWRGTLPSNTLSCLNSLTEDAVRSGAFGRIDVRVEVIDEIVTRVNPAALGRRFRRDGTTVVVGLVGVQTNQIPRAQDLAREFRAEGFTVIIGGFHVSGAMAMSPTTPPECRALLDAGVTLVLGEVEGRWAGILLDALAGRLEPIYDFLHAPPDLGDAPLPQASRRTQRRFVMARNGTIDAGRGCPFACSFCTIINVQGRTMRARSAAHIIEQVRRNYWLNGRRGVRHYFFTDDNFARNPQWEPIFDGLIGLRDAEGLDVAFMMQVDTQAPKIPGFAEKAARAGCVQVFIGVESIRADNLAAGGKPQNRVADYRDMIARWHEVGVVCHAGVIIGFPHDTYERVMEDVQTLAETMRVDQASFFMLTPLPGSRDHQAAVAVGPGHGPGLQQLRCLPPDHPPPADECRRVGPGLSRRVEGVLLVRAHAAHPARPEPAHLLAGAQDAVVVQGRHDRRGAPDGHRAVPSEGQDVPAPLVPPRAAVAVLSGAAPARSRRLLREYLKLYLEMQELWLRTRIRRDDYSFLGDLGTLGPQSIREVKLAWARIHTAVVQRLAALHDRVGAEVSGLSATMTERLDIVREALGNRAAALRLSVTATTDPPAARGDPSSSAASGARARAETDAQAALAVLRLPALSPSRRVSRLRRMARRVNPLSIDRIDHSPALAAYWTRARQTLRRLELWRVNPLALTWNFLRAGRRAVVFLAAMRGERY